MIFHFISAFRLKRFSGTSKNNSQKACQSFRHVSKLENLKAATGKYSKQDMNLLDLKC